jgi:hypothetical protein
MQPTANLTWVNRLEPGVSPSYFSRNNLSFSPARHDADRFDRAAPERYSITGATALPVWG